MHHIATTITLGLTDLGRAHALNFVDTNDRVHWNKAALDAIKLIFELFFARIDHQLRALTEDQLFDLHEAPQLALKNLLCVEFKNLSLIVEDNPKDRLTFFTHSGMTNTLKKTMDATAAAV